jgi:hypothetical protein
MRLQRWSVTVFTLAVASSLAFVIACGVNTSKGAGGGAGGGGAAGGGAAGGGAAGGGAGGGGAGYLPASITIEAPAPGATVSTPGTVPVAPVTFSVTNFTLVDPSRGTCASTSSDQSAACGSVYETTDGTFCNVAGAAFNSVFTSSPGDVLLDACTTGLCAPHTTTLELRNGDGSLFTCDGACPDGVSTSVSYTAVDCQPVITILSPASGATVEPTAGTAHTTAPIAFSVSNFTMAAPGTCNGSANCGNIHETTDGTACNLTAPFNHIFVASPGDVWLDLCTTGVCGPHTTTLELHNDYDALYTCGGNCPQGISTSVSYTVDPGACPPLDGGPG